MKDDFFKGITHDFDLKHVFYVCVLVAVIAAVIMIGEGVV